MRAINQKLPRDKRLRVLAGDPPVDWAQIDRQKYDRYVYARNANVASVMEKEVLSKRRKALMLFGLGHLAHGGGDGTYKNAVATYEKDYPGKTFVIGSLAFFDLNANGSAAKPFEKWSYPSLTQLAGTWLGAMDITHFYSPNVDTDKDCNPHFSYIASDQKPMSEITDALLYLGPGDLTLAEPAPADIVLDAPFMAEMFRRDTLMGQRHSKTIQEYEQYHVQDDADTSQPIFKLPTVADIRIQARRECLERQKQATIPK